MNRHPFSGCMLGRSTGRRVGSVPILAVQHENILIFNVSSGFLTYRADMASILTGRKEGSPRCRLTPKFKSMHAWPTNHSPSLTLLEASHPHEGTRYFLIDRLSHDSRVQAIQWISLHATIELMINMMSTGTAPAEGKLPV